MPAIASARTVLVSAPYADWDEPEVQANFPNGPKRTIGLIEVTLDNGVTGVGEGYMAVFAPVVFRELVTLMTPHVVGRDASDIAARVADLRQVSDYWSLSGAARHAISAFETALVDAEGKRLGIPAYAVLGDVEPLPLALYGSGGNCVTRSHFERELELLQSLGIDKYKVRASIDDAGRAAWIVREAARRGIAVAVDLCQNLARDPIEVRDVIRFVGQIEEVTGTSLLFVEEPLGPTDEEGFRELRRTLRVPVAGGETVTTPWELTARLRSGVYDIVQPDASVIGGVSAVQAISREVADPAAIVVHAWGGPVAQLANYHGAIASRLPLAEYPMLASPLGQRMTGRDSLAADGFVRSLERPGLGVSLTPDIERDFPFDPKAVYDCSGDAPAAPSEDWS